MGTLKKPFSNRMQEKQDAIFRSMSANKKIEIGSILWKMAKDIVGDKINYAKSGSAPSVGSNRKNIRPS